MSENYFVTLNKINVNDKTELKGRLTYLSWAWAWGEVKKLFPDASYTVYEAANGCLYHTDGKTCWVKTGVTINGIEYIEYLPIMDARNASIPLDKVTSMDANKAIQRSITKAIARHGLGLYIYAGEDLPEGEEPQKPGWREPPEGDEPIVCEECGYRINDYFDGEKLIKAAQLGERSRAKNGRVLCTNCTKRNK